MSELPPETPPYFPSCSRYWSTMTAYSGAGVLTGHSGRTPRAAAQHARYARYALEMEKFDAGQ